MCLFPSLRCDRLLRQVYSHPCAVIGSCARYIPIPALRLAPAPGAGPAAVGGGLRGEPDGGADGAQAAVPGAGGEAPIGRAAAGAPAGGSGGGEQPATHRQRSSDGGKRGGGQQGGPRQQAPGAQIDKLRNVSLGRRRLTFKLNG
eukprot:508254-Prorocentrum_minimum.AAC.1